MANDGGAAEKLKAAELLLSDAIRDRDDAQNRVDWLTSMVEQYRGRRGIANGRRSEPSLFSDATPEVEVHEGQDSADVGYGAVKNAVYDVMRDAHRKLDMGDIVGRFEALNMKTEAKNVRESVRNAIKALMKDGKVRKMGRFHYRAVE